MVRKIIFGLLMTLLALSLIGCGEDDSNKNDGTKDDNKPPANSAKAPATPADESILGVAEYSIFGESEHDAGMSAADKEKFYLQVVMSSAENFRKLYFSDENAEILALKYFAHLKDEMKISTKIIDANPEQPIVEVSATPIDSAAIQDYMANSEALAEIQSLLQQLTASGVNLEDLRADENFQTQATEIMERYIAGIPVSAEGVKTLQIKCNDADGHWVPEDPAALRNFLTGQQ